MSKEPENRTTQTLATETPPKPKKSKTGGRKKGTPNKNTWTIRQSLEGQKFDPVAEFIQAFQALTDPKDKLDRLTWLFRYVFPQLKEVETPPEPANPASQPKPSASQASTDSLLSLVKPTK